MDVDGLNVRPRAGIGEVRPDLVDEDLRLVIDGWLVLRFAWEDVMFDQDQVRAVHVALSTSYTDGLKSGVRAAFPRRARGSEPVQYVRLRPH